MNQLYHLTTAVAVLCLFLQVLAMPSIRSFFLKQSFNLPGIMSIKTVLQNPSLLLPTIQLQSLSELNLIQLQSKDVKYIVFDKDNTLR